MGEGQGEALALDPSQTAKLSYISVQNLVPSMVARTTNKAENAPQATSGMRCQVIHA